ERFPSDDFVAREVDLVGPIQQNLWRVKRKISNKVAGHARGNDSQNPKNEAPMERQVLRAEFLAAYFDRFLPAQIAWLVFHQLRTEVIGVGGSRSIALDGLYACHTTTSFSSFTP